MGGLEGAKEEEQKSRKPRRREQSCLVRGQQSIQAAVVRAEVLPQGYVVSELWPTQTYRPTKRVDKWGGKNTKREANRSSKQRRRARGDEADKKKVRDHVQARRERQRQAQRATKANQKAERRKEQEAERKRLQQEQATRRMQHKEEHQRQKQEEQAHKQEVRVRAREEREQIREERRLWHQELQRERVARQLRQEERAARRSSLALDSPSASSKKVALQQALAEPPEPP